MTVPSWPAGAGFPLELHSDVSGRRHVFGPALLQACRTEWRPEVRLPHVKSWTQ